MDSDELDFWSTWNQILQATVQAVKIKFELDQKSSSSRSITLSFKYQAQINRLREKNLPWFSSLSGAYEIFKFLW